MSSGQEFNGNRMILTQTSQLDYEELCQLDVFVWLTHLNMIRKQCTGNSESTLSEVSQDGTRLACHGRGNQPPLPNNKQGILQRLNNLTRKLQQSRMTAEYDNIIAEEKDLRVVKPAVQPAKGMDLYIPHKPRGRALNQQKACIVYDASAQADLHVQSLNKCVYPGPPLQNKLWDVLVQQRAYPIAVTGDINKASLQIPIKEAERDAL